MVVVSLEMLGFEVYHATLACFAFIPCKELSVFGWKRCLYLVCVEVGTTVSKNLDQTG